MILSLLSGLGKKKTQINQRELMKRKKQHDKESRQRRFFKACKKGDLEQVCNLTQDVGALVVTNRGTKRVIENNEWLIQAQDSMGNTPLHEASSWGRVGVVKHLIQSGAHPNVRNFCGSTPLFEACMEGHFEVANVLVQAGAKIDDDLLSHCSIPQGKWLRSCLITVVLCQLVMGTKYQLPIELVRLVCSMLFN